jgi:queuine tRNA-ribosyltransferase
MLGARLATVHNLYFYLELMREIRASLAEGTFPQRVARAGGVWA